MIPSVQFNINGNSCETGSATVPFRDSPNQNPRRIKHTIPTQRHHWHSLCKPSQLRHSQVRSSPQQWKQEEAHHFFTLLSSELNCIFFCVFCTQNRGRVGVEAVAGFGWNSGRPPNSRGSNGGGHSQQPHRARSFGGRQRSAEKDTWD